MEGFPLESVARAPSSGLYLELWPPDRSFADVVRWIDRARQLADGRQVVIAAYAVTLKEPESVDDRAAAFEASLLLGSVIAASGAYHHTIASGDRLLVEGYYPVAAPLQDAEVSEMQALWRFSGRYLHLLSGPDSEPVHPSELRLDDDAGDPVPWSERPEAGMVWVRASRTPEGQIVVHLIDLRAQRDDLWDTPKLPPARSSRLRLSWYALGSPIVASPWADDGDATPLCHDDGGWILPEFRRWLMVVAS